LVSCRIDTAELIERVKEIFEGRDELIRGFNAFLPEESRIAVEEPLVREQPVTYEETVGFVLRVKVWHDFRLSGWKANTEST